MRNSKRVLLFVLLPAALAGMPQSLPSPSSPSWTVNGGFWRTDAGFSPTIQLKNRLTTGPIAVTPVLFMADGTEYDLAVVNLPASSVATIDVKAFLTNAPAGARKSHLRLRKRDVSL